MMLGRDAVVGYVWLDDPHVDLGSATVTRVSTDQPDPAFVRRPVGFVARPTEAEPLLWEGDDA